MCILCGIAFSLEPRSRSSVKYQGHMFFEIDHCRGISVSQTQPVACFRFTCFRFNYIILLWYVTIQVPEPNTEAFSCVLYM